MKNKYTRITIIILIIYIIINIITLSFSPLPWYDEICFASISESVAKNGTFYNTAFSLSNFGKPVYLYGPVYFVIESIFIKYYGLSAFSFRIVNFIAFFIDIFLIYKICKRFKYTEAATTFCIAFILFDPISVQDLHSGRMEFIMLLFFLISINIFFEIKNELNVRNFSLSLICGLSSGLALLTSSRSIFFLFVFFPFFIYELLSKNTNKINIIGKYFLISISLSVPLFYWIYSKFGSINAYINAFLGDKLVKSHIGFQLNNYSFDYHHIFFICIFLHYFYSRLRRNKLQMPHEIVYLTLVSICSYFLIVKNISSTYFSLIVPFIAIYLSGAMQGKQKIMIIINNVIISIFVIIFVAKISLVLMSLKQRDYSYYHKEIDKYIEPGSFVAGDPLFFYLIKANNCIFESIESNQYYDNYQKTLDYFGSGKFRYFIIKGPEKKIEEYKKNMLQHYHEKAHIANPSLSIYYIIIKYLPMKIYDSYDCYIFELNR